MLLSKHISKALIFFYITFCLCAPTYKLHLIQLLIVRIHMRQIVANYGFIYFILQKFMGFVKNMYFLKIHFTESLHYSSMTQNFWK